MENDQLRSEPGSSSSSRPGSWDSNKPSPTGIALVDILDTAFNSTVDQPQNVDFTLDDMEYDPLFISESEMDVDSRDGAPPDPSLPSVGASLANIWSYRGPPGPEEALGWPPLAEPLPLYYDGVGHHHRGPGAHHQFTRGSPPVTSAQVGNNGSMESYEARRKRSLLNGESELPVFSRLKTKKGEHSKHSNSRSSRHDATARTDTESSQPTNGHHNSSTSSSSQQHVMGSHSTGGSNHHHHHHHNHHHHHHSHNSNNNNNNNSQASSGNSSNTNSSSSSNSTRKPKSSRVRSRFIDPHPTPSGPSSTGGSHIKMEMEISAPDPSQSGAGPSVLSIQSTGPLPAFQMNLSMGAPPAPVGPGGEQRTETSGSTPPSSSNGPLAPDLQLDWISSDSSPEVSDDDSGIEIISVHQGGAPGPSVPVVDLTVESDEEGVAAAPRHLTHYPPPRQLVLVPGRHRLPLVCTRRGVPPIPRPSAPRLLILPCPPPRGFPPLIWPHHHPLPAAWALCLLTVRLAGARPVWSRGARLVLPTRHSRPRQRSGSRFAGYF
ncbi:hypothetical protein WDU94_012824, partial [Cyamophila willieti]